MSIDKLLYICGIIEVFAIGVMVVGAVGSAIMWYQLWKESKNERKST